MDKKLILKIVSLTGTIVAAVATMMIADDDKKELETKIFNDVMNNVTTAINETKEVI